jgi:hypothetical protein
MSELVEATLEGAAAKFAMDPVRFVSSGKADKWLSDVASAVAPAVTAVPLLMVIHVRRKRVQVFPGAFEDTAAVMAWLERFVGGEAEWVAMPVSSDAIVEHAAEWF